MKRAHVFSFLLVTCLCLLLSIGCEDAQQPSPAVVEPSGAQTEEPVSEPSQEPVLPKEPYGYTGRPLEEILSLANNEKSYDELIQTVYTNEELKEIYWTNTPIYKIEQLCPIECLRKVDDETYYSVHKSDEGELLFLAYGVHENKYYNAMSAWFLHEPLTVESFSSIKARVSTLADVREIDPYGDERYVHSSSPATLFRSCHYTADGQIVYIDYKWAEGLPVISIGSISALDAKIITDLKYIEESAYKFLLPIDREAVAKLLN